MLTNGYTVSLWGDGNVLEWIVVMAAQICEYTKIWCNLYAER